MFARVTGGVRMTYRLKYAHDYYLETDGKIKSILRTTWLTLMNQNGVWTYGGKRENGFRFDCP